MIKHINPGTGFLAFCVWAVVALSSYVGLLDRIKFLEFDYLSISSPSPAEQNPIIIVGIDDASLLDLGLQWPWQRDLHAKTIKYLHADGAAVIAFDIIFAEPSTTSADKALEQAIRDTGNVVLASDVAYIQSDYFEQLISVEPLQQFLDAGAATGVSNVTLDTDLIIRSTPGSTGSFWGAITNQYLRRSGEEPIAATSGNEKIHYTGPAHSFKYVSYYQVARDGLLPEGFFKDKIVMIGLDVKSSVDPVASQADMFATPYIHTTNLLTPGVEIVSTMVVNALNGDFIIEKHQNASLAGALISMLIIILLTPVWYPGRAVIISIITASSSAGFLWLLFEYENIWISNTPILLSTLLFYLASGAIAYLHESKRKRVIRNAFEYYVSPNVVNEMINQPGKLALGGEKKTITLMFTDLAGFTNFSESMSPENVATVLNKHFTAMTKIIIDHHGTVDKFIGDAIMAFWGAPISDEDHAIHACKAAELMQIEMEKLRSSLVESGYPAIHMRIGLNTGEAIVGNMGSNDRFDYTALGDSVNLAARLEGVNKYYGTEILISESTASIITDEIPLIYLDTVRVKGKSKAVRLYTINHDAEILALIDEASRTYYDRQWDVSEQLWKKLAEYPSMQQVTAIYLGRIKTMREKGSISDDDFIVSLDKM